MLSGLRQQRNRMKNWYTSNLRISTCQFFKDMLYLEQLNNQGSFRKEAESKVTLRPLEPVG